MNLKLGVLDILPNCNDSVVSTNISSNADKTIYLNKENLENN